MFNFKKDNESVVLYDRTLLFLVISLICIGIIMIFSASVTQAQNKMDNMFYFMQKDFIAICIAGFFGVVLLSIPTEKYRNLSVGILFLCAFLLILVLCIGSEINHAKRWIRIFGLMNLQPGEFVKVLWILYLASFLVRKHDEVVNNWMSFPKLLFPLIIIGSLLLIQPDYGTVVVLCGIFAVCVFMAGANIVCYIVIIALGGSSLFALAIFEPYRLLRITSFMDPWKEAFGAGYQLTQSLMAFGRGGWVGEGVGNSILKMEYLPEAHTDFVLSILGEECGFIGVSLVVFLEFWLMIHLFVKCKKFLRENELFNGYVCCGVATMLCIQTTINVGATSGILPTKGLTLPLISYGGSSMAAIVSALAIVLRLDYEYRKKKYEMNKQIVESKE